MFDDYTKDMLFETISNVYSDSEQLDIIEYLAKKLQEWNTPYEKNSIEELYYKGLEKIVEDIKELKVKEHNYQLD